MAEQNTLVDLKVTMKKHPESLKLEGSLKELLDKSVPLTEPLILYNGIHIIINYKFILEFFFSNNCLPLSLSI